MNYTATDVKNLRDSTGAGLLDCKKALNETNGDMAAAEKLLKERGLAAMASRTDRTAAEGRIVIKQDGNNFAIVEVLCETDFVANNADFIAVAEKVCEATLAKKESGILPEHKTLIDSILVKFRENISVKRAEYIEVPASYVDEQTDIFKAQMAEDPAMAKKPENVKEGILKGKVNKLLSSICFMDQAYLDNEKITVTQALQEASKTAGATLSFEKVVLYVLGK